MINAPSNPVKIVTLLVKSGIIDINKAGYNKTRADIPIKLPNCSASIKVPFMSLDANL